MAAGSLSHLANIWVGPPIRATYRALFLTHTCRLWLSPVSPLWHFPLADQALSTASVELLSPIRVTLLPLHVSALFTASTVVLHPTCRAVVGDWGAEALVAVPAALALLPQPQPPTVLGWQPEGSVEPHTHAYTDTQVKLSHAADLHQHTKLETNVFLIC